VHQFEMLILPSQNLWVWDWEL